MQLITERITYHSRSDQFHWYHLSDLHVGARACDEKLLRQHIRTIVDDPVAIVTFGGDLADFIARKGDKRHLESTLAPWCWGKDDVLQTQLDYLRDELLIAPLCAKAVAVLNGNHEASPDQYQGAGVYRQIVKHIAQHKGCQPAALALGYSGFVQFQFKRVASTGRSGSGWSLTAYLTHGYGGGKLAGGHALELERILGRYECDVAIAGHRHTEAYVPVMTSRVVGNRVVQSKRIGLFVAGYLGGGTELSKGELPPTTYDQLKGYYPTTRGCVAILIDPDGAKVPDNPGAQFAITTALDSKATKANINVVMKYMSRLSVEFQTIFFRAALRRDDSLTQTKTYMDWGLKHQNILT